MIQMIENGNGGDLNRCLSVGMYQDEFQNILKWLQS